MFRSMAVYISRSLGLPTRATTANSISWPRPRVRAQELPEVDVEQVFNSPSAAIDSPMVRRYIQPHPPPPLLRPPLAYNNVPKASVRF